MPMRELKAVQLHYRRSGRRSAPCLLLSNSLGTDMSMWRPQMSAFEKHFHVLRYDMRGHGVSSVPPGPYSIEECGLDVLGLLDDLEIRKVSFCGLSLGGVIGQWLAVHAAHRLERLVLANTAAKMGDPEAWNARIESVMRSGMRGIADAVLARWFTPAFLDSANPDVLAMRYTLEHTNPVGYLGMCAAIRDMDQRELVKSINIPTLILAGIEDVVTTIDDAEFLTSAIRGATQVILPAAHISNIEAASCFGQRVVDFLREGKRNER